MFDLFVFVCVYIIINSLFSRKKKKPGYKQIASIAICVQPKERPKGTFCVCFCMGCIWDILSKFAC